MSAEFTISTETYKGTLVIKTVGYINNTAGEKLVEEFEKNFIGGLNRVIIDLEHSNVVNSIGISHLIDIIEKLNQSNSKLVFTNLDSTIEKTFNIMGIFQFAEKADSVDSALE